MPSNETQIENQQYMKI